MGVYANFDQPVVLCLPDTHFPIVELYGQPSWWGDADVDEDRPSSRPVSEQVSVKESPLGTPTLPSPNGKRCSFEALSI